jgi:chorismate dehydratase
MSVTIGSVPYLNARPLVDWFSSTEEGKSSQIRIIEAVPAQLAEMLKRGEIACALLSSVTKFRNPEWIYAPGAAIGSYGPVESVRLFSKRPFKTLRTVALDSSSLTSVAFIKILLEQWIGVKPDYISLPPILDVMLKEADAGLLIGDNGYREYDPNLFVLDMGQAWTEWTALPFVYALWLGPPATLTPEVADVLLVAKEWGTLNIAAIAERTAKQHGKTVPSAIHYMTNAIRYDLGIPEIAGLNLFGEKLGELGLI